MFTSLMTSKRFAPLFWCQFLSALNDNFVRNALVILVMFQLGTQNGAVLVTLAGVALIAPFFILSGIGGQLADRYDKAIIATRLKQIEIAIAAVAAIGFLIQSVPLLFLALTGYGVIAALFGPIKYGLLPIQLSQNELPAGNALVEGATFIAILLGTVIGGLAASNGGGAMTPVAGMVIILAVLCWLSAKLIPKTGEADPHLKIDFNPISSTWTLVKDLWAVKRLRTGGLITAWFWAVGAVMVSLLPQLVKERLGGTEGVYITALLIFTVAISVGSALAARASRMRPNLALVPVASLLMALFCLDLAWAVSTYVKPEVDIGAVEFFSAFAGWRIVIDLAGLALAGGLYIVPSFAAVQSWASADHKARVIAACNVLSAAFMTTASLTTALIQSQGGTPALIILALGIGNLIALVLVLRAWGAEGVKDVAAFLFKTFLGLEVKGLENLPKPGEKAIIAPNHVSLLDAPIIHSLMPSYAAFAIDTGMANTSWVKPFLKLAKTYPIDPTRPLGTRSLIQTVKDGSSIVIFPEGRLTVTGGLMKVYDGTAMIADKADAPVIPVRIDGPERSPFGYLASTQTKKTWFPKTTVTILPRVKLNVDDSLRGKSRRQAAGAALQDIMIDTAVSTAPINQTLFEALALAKDTKNTGKPAVEDPLGTKLSYKKLITSAQVLGKKLRPMTSEGASVGVLLPNSAGVAVVFFALQTIGRVPAMLNFTAGAKNVTAACTAAKVEIVLTSRAFIEKAHLEALATEIGKVAKLVYLEDVRATIGWQDKLSGLLAGSKQQVARHPNAPAAILFTSGSEGTPKGVVLSHRNMLANCYQSLMRVAANGSDKVFNALPVFHSFGLTAGLLMPLVGGIPVYLYPTPLHYRIIPELVYQTNATILFGTDTFLNGYARAAHPYDFNRVRLVLAGAEAVKERTRKIFMDKFGVRILEGYGVTETAPVLAINTPLTNKSGTVGRLSPLMEAKLEPVPGIDSGGRLYVRGPNVMLGYYKVDNPGVLEPPADGWHDTGDIVEIDAQGFITIKGRAKRFAKIAGEMVSLSAVEAAAADLWPGENLLVVAVPDLRKGERLILVTKNPACTRSAFAEFARHRGLTELMVPSEVMVVETIPLLGSGKPDYVSAAALVKERLAKTSAAPQAEPAAV